LKSNGYLLLAAIIWGFAFTAQRTGMAYVGPFTFNTIRFALGCIALLPVIFWFHRSKRYHAAARSAQWKTWFLGGGVAGLLLFGGSTFQQIGIVYTTAGKAGFITGLYVILVPLLGLFVKLKTGYRAWIGAFLASYGLYLLSVTRDLTMSGGDMLVLVSAIFWAMHVLLIGRLSPGINPFLLAFTQFAVCSFLSLICTLCFETVTCDGLTRAAVPILYAGLISVGIAYTLQVVGQRHAKPAPAAIILSLEAVFAVIGGMLILGEHMSFREVIGCGLMLSGMMLSQTGTEPEKTTPSN
jgi:drug/metabolite transporter (DMT)-like permease